MSEKQRGGIRKCLPVVLEELKKGIDIGALRDKGDCRHDTLYVIRDILSGAKLIFEEGGKWYYTCKKEKEELLKDYQEFKNMDEYSVKRDHSKAILKKAIQDNGSTDFNIYRFVSSADFKYFLKHLETGYPDIYNMWIIMENNEPEMEEKYLLLEEELRKIAKEKYVELRELPSPIKTVKVGSIIMKSETANLRDKIRAMPEDVFSCFERYLFYMLNKEEFEVIGDWDPVKNKWIPRYETGYTDIILDGKIHRGHWSEWEVMDYFIKPCTQSEDLNRLYEEFVRVTKEIRKSYDLFSNKVQPVILKVLEHGEPLRGNCDLCPKITIGRVS